MLDLRNISFTVMFSEAQPGEKDHLNSHRLPIHAMAVNISTAIGPPQSIGMSAHFFTSEH